jgi:propionate catabolism operon transcriptional regulator
VDTIKVVCVTFDDYQGVFKRVVERFKPAQMEVIYFEGYLDNLMEGYAQWLREGVDVIIATGGNYGVLNTYASIPVIGVQIHTGAYIHAIKEAAGDVVLPYYAKTPIVSVEALRGLTASQVEIAAYETKEALEEIILHAKGKTVIGGCLANRLAAHHAVNSILLVPEEETIVNALIESETMARHLRAEKRKRDLLEAVIKHTANGILSVSSNGTISMVNPSAIALLNLQGDVLERTLESVLPHFSKCRTASPQMGTVIAHEGKRYVVNWIPFETEASKPAGVFIFQSSTDIIDAERSLRRSMRDKGLYAKATFEDIIGDCDLLRDEIKRAKLYAMSESNVLIYGETGVGKELFAQSIHRFSERQDGPFVAVNCAAIPGTLMESELFGYDEGAFTGSRRGGKAGLFELAHGGTLFLDEIGEIDMAVQARLLRVIQEKEVMRIGGDKLIPIDVRIITATNARLIEKMPHAFREDLFYRLDVLSLSIPPLRERGNDVFKLFQKFLKHHLPLDTMTFFMPEMSKWVLDAYAWPGNIRELQSVVERFAIQYRQLTKLSAVGVHEILISAIGAEKLSKSLLKELKYNPEEDFNQHQKSKRAAEALEKAFPGRKQFIAAQLGLSRTTLWRRLNEN